MYRIWITKILECFKELKKKNRNSGIRMSSFYFLHEIFFFFFEEVILYFFFYKDNWSIWIQIDNKYKYELDIWIQMGGENNSFFFLSLLYVRYYYCFNIFCFVVGKKIKLKVMLFHNLYEDILVRQKLKTKQGNPLINSIDTYFKVSCKIRSKWNPFYKDHYQN